jgi:hypothetical protein
MKKLFTIILVSAFIVGFSQEIKPTTTTTVDPTTNTTTTVTTTTVSTSSTKDSKRAETFSKKNELRIDPTYLVFAGALNVNYERILNSESGAGATLILSNGKDINTTFALSPYYRFYFGKKPAAGFFFEGFTMLSSFKTEKYKPTGPIYDGISYSYIEYKKMTDLAIGFGLGGKWMTNGGFVFELSGGVGRNLLNDYSNYTGGSNIVGKGGLSIGYRF